VQKKKKENLTIAANSAALSMVQHPLVTKQTTITMTSVLRDVPSAEAVFSATLKAKQSLHKKRKKGKRPCGCFPAIFFLRLCIVCAITHLSLFFFSCKCTFAP
jgi:hypothetical protein